MDTVTLLSGRSMAKLGLGTWRMGDSPATHQAEAAALRISSAVLAQAIALAGE